MSKEVENEKENKTEEQSRLGREMVSVPRSLFFRKSKRGGHLWSKVDNAPLKQDTTILVSIDDIKEVLAGDARYAKGILLVDDGEREMVSVPDTGTRQESK